MDRRPWQRTVGHMLAWRHPTERLGQPSGSDATSAVIDLSTVRFEQIDPPALTDRGHPELVTAWQQTHEMEVHQLEADPHRWNGPILFTYRLRPDRDGAVVEYFVGDYAAIRAAQSLSARLDPDTPAEAIGSLLDNGLSICVAVACKDGWIVAQRSARVAGSGLWQHAAAEGLELSDMSGDVWLQATRRALREELNVEAGTIHPWVLERLALTGRSFRLYTVAEIPEHTLHSITSLRESAPDAWETNALRAMDATELWDLPMLRHMLVPLWEPRETAAVAAAGFRPDRESKEAVTMR